MKKSIPIIPKHIINSKKKNPNPPNSSRQSNTTNINQGNISSISSLTSPSISRKTKDPNKILSPTNKYLKNQKKQELNNYKSKTSQTFFQDHKNTDNSNLEHDKQLKKSFLSKEIDSNTEKIKRLKIKTGICNDNNIGNTSLKTPMAKYNTSKKALLKESWDKNKDIPGLKELDKDIMKAYNKNK